MPPEICPEHDLRIDEFGCWVCGHAGPITEAVWPSWAAWVGSLPYDPPVSPERYAAVQRGQLSIPRA
jgi:hypothetical protein